VFTVQRLLGHASPATTQRYVQTSDATMRGLVDAVAGLDVRRPATQREEA
jgi:site-specific recombinase XerD